MHDLTAFQRDLLFVIAGHGDPIGAAIRAELEQHYEEEIDAGRLYPNLDTLVDKRLIDKEEVESDERANCYRLTRRGKRDVKPRLEWETQYLDDSSPR